MAGIYVNINGNIADLFERFITYKVGKVEVLVWFYGISTIVGYLMPNLFYTYILNIYDFVLWHINDCRVI